MGMGLWLFTDLSSHSIEFPTFYSRPHVDVPQKEEGCLVFTENGCGPLTNYFYSPISTGKLAHPQHSRSVQGKDPGRHAEIAAGAPPSSLLLYSTHTSHLTTAPVNGRAWFFTHGTDNSKPVSMEVYRHCLWDGGGLSVGVLVAVHTSRRGRGRGYCDPGDDGRMAAGASRRPPRRTAQNSAEHPHRHVDGTDRVGGNVWKLASGSREPRGWLSGGMGE